MKRTRIAILCFFMLTLAVPATAPAAEGPSGRLGLGLGLGISFLTSEYKKTDATFPPLPLLRYEGERFYLRGLTGGLNVYKQGIHELSLTLGYMPQHFNASRSDSWAMRRLDDRDPTLMGGVNYKITTPWGVGNLSLATDVLGKSNGLMGEASYAYPIPLGKLTLVPNAGLIWTSSNFNDYYYGVDGKESRKSGLDKYSADSGVNPYFGLNAQLALGGSWSAFAMAKAMFLNDEITDSPMVDEKMKYTFGAGIQYNF